MMSQEQPQRPVTYKDVFGDAVQGEVGDEAVTMEDAGLMQTAEAIGFGKTAKGGAASLMQSAADKNVRDHLVDPVSHSNAAEEGFGLRETVVDGKVHRQQLVGQQAIAEEIKFVPTLAELAGTQGITIGEALEETAFNNQDKIVDDATARAILSAEARATGMPFPLKGGVGAAAQSAAQKNAVHGQQIQLSDVLNDATTRMLVDKVATQEDVEKVKRGSTSEEETVIASGLQAAVDANVSADRYIKDQENEVDTLLSSSMHEPLLPQEQPSTVEPAPLRQDEEPHAHAD